MRRKFFTLLFAATASVGTMLAETVHVGDFMYFIDPSSKTAELLGSSSVISVNDNSISDWDALPVKYVAESVCPANPLWTGLKKIKVYADDEYINYMLIFDPASMPSHTSIDGMFIFINADNSAQTGGYWDLFAPEHLGDVDLMFEGALWDDEGREISYNPTVSKWVGELGGEGWEWEILPSSGKIGDSQFVGNNTIEGRLKKSLIPWNNWADQFSIGIGISQNFEMVGLLPQGNTPDGELIGRVNKLNVTFAHNQSTLSENIVIPSTIEYNGVKYNVTQIADRAFSNNVDITSVSISNTVISIGDRTFEGCESLASVTIGNGVKSIGDYAFEGCENLKTVSISDIAAWCAITFGNVEEEYYYGEGAPTANPLYYAHQLYMNEQMVTDLVIPNTVTKIGNFAFYTCRSLNSVTIPNNVKSIGRGAFYYCKNVKSFTITAGIEEIGNYAFTGCEGVTYYEGPLMAYGGVSRDADNIDTIIINSGTLDEENYYSWPSSVIKLDLYAVETEILPESMTRCYNLKELILPAHLRTIGYMAVAGCLHLEQVTIPATVTKIEDRAFEDCRTLAKVIFEQGSQLQSIGNWAFYNCHELAQLEIPEGVKEIGKAAFYGCTYLANVVLPASMLALGDNAFALCAKMQKMVVKAVTPPTIETKTFAEVSREMPVYVPDASVATYKADALWGELNIQGISNIQMALDQISQQPIANSKKLIKDGQILILRGNHTYTLTGQEVSE